MKITKRQLRRLVREALIKESRGPATPEYVYSALKTPAAAGPNKGVPFGEIAMDAAVASEWQAAANAVMNALWVDDPWQKDVEALEDMLAEVDPGDIPDLALVGAKWLTIFRQDGFTTEEDKQAEMANWR